MSTSNEALMRRWFDEVWNKQNSQAISELMASDAIAHGLGPNNPLVRGHEAFLEMHTAFLGAFPDMHIMLDPVVASGDLVAGQFLCQATHIGNHLGIPATGKPVTFRGMTIARYRNGKIVEGWNCIDLLPVFVQAGLVSQTETLP